MRRAMSWVDEGGALVVFPAGEVAHWLLRHAQVVERPWGPAAGRSPVWFAEPVQLCFRC
jgi:hypothetical protein